MSIVMFLSRCNCFGSSVLFAMVTVVATVASGSVETRVEPTADQNTVFSVSESCPGDLPGRFDESATADGSTDSV